MQSPGFSRFRELMDKWDDWLAIEDERVSIGDHLDGNQCILFFKKGDDIFGAPEESRLVFAKLKNPSEEDVTPSWRDEARFIALNLVQSLLGQRTENLFGGKDLDDLQMMDRDAAVEELMKKKPKKKKEK
jgi:hypothetical protein